VQERRLVLRVLNHWQELRGARSFAARRELDPAVLGDDRRYCCVLDLDDESDPVFAYVGVAFDAAHVPSEVRRVSNCRLGSFLGLATEFFPRVLEKRIPVSIGGEATSDGRSILFRAILLPLSSDGTRIDALLGAANCRASGDAAT
jgi:hypothetical protein